MARVAAPAGRVRPAMIAPPTSMRCAAPIIDRRDAMLAMLGVAGSLIAPAGAMAGEEGGAAPGPQAAFAHLSEPILAYEFDYPTATASGRPLPLVFSRRPERYSSAAPLTADARQRIVCELADLIDAVTVSVSVGPPSGALKGIPPAEWDPRQVAEAVLVDRSTARVTSGQRVSLSVVEEASAVTRDGVTYYLYEHVSQGSPTLASSTRETYRHALAVTAARPGVDGSLFLYTLNMAGPQERWADLEPGFRAGVASFTLPTPGPDYVAPDANPWRFF